MMPPPRPDRIASVMKPIGSRRWVRASTPPRMALANTPVRSTQRTSSVTDSLATAPAGGQAITPTDCGVNPGKTVARELPKRLATTSPRTLR